MKNIAFDSKKYACMSDLQRIEWARKRGIDITPTTSGMVTLNPIKAKRFTILKGNEKSILGIKNDGTAPDDSLYDELDEYFKLAPSGLERCYSFVNDKVVTDLKGDIGPPFRCYPFGYVM